MKSFVAIIISLLCAAGLRAELQPPVEKNPPPLDPSNRDLSVKPQDDFFMFANGGWIKRTQMPPEYSRWGSFNELIENNNDALHDIAEKAENTQIDPRLAQRHGRENDRVGATPPPG